MNQRNDKLPIGQGRKNLLPVPPGHQKNPQDKIGVFQKRIQALSNTIRFRLIIGTIMLVLVYGIGNYLLIKSIVRPRQHEMEQSIARKDMARSIATLDYETELLTTLAADWAAWDDAYAFIRNPTHAFIDSQLTYSAFASNNLTLIQFYNRKGILVWSRILDLEAGQDIPLDAFSGRGLAENHPLLSHQKTTSSLSGLLITSRGPMIIASKPIVTSDYHGPIAGTLIFGKLINEKVLQDMRTRIRVDFHYHLIHSPQLSAEVPATVIEQLQNGNPFAYYSGKRSLQIFSYYHDYLGQEALVLNLDNDRILTDTTNTILGYVLLSNLGVGIIALFLLLLLHRKVVSTASKMFHISILMSELDPLKVEEGLSLVEQNIIQMGRELQYEAIDSKIPIPFRHDKEENKSIMLWKMNLQLTKEIRERVKAEKALLESQEDLEARIEKRTKNLTETNFRLENEILERKKLQERMEKYQDRLRTLSSELLSIEERERSQIAQDLHDGIGQALSVSRMQLDCLVEEVKDPDILEQLNKTISILTQTLKDTRTLTFELSPPILYELGLVPALEWLTEQLEEQHRLSVELDIEEVPSDTSRPCMTLIFRTIRELLINVARHAGIDRAKVDIKINGDILKIKVIDWGRGFPREQLDHDFRKEEGGFGLFSIQERVKNIGGTFSIDSTLGRGTIVSITLRFPCSHCTNKEDSQCCSQKS
jgi:signal transduction histidine kinase/sensor domain CHASE-containing protein